MTHADETPFLPADAVYMHEGESCGYAEGELVVTPACSEKLRGYNLYWETGRANGLPIIRKLRS